ncbi:MULTISPECIES: LLM class flavin-dependent oxidoreductase [unclassified Paenibacillus]|uniref:LLM class flavin-dependent oxidoreductase n=1 Tax=unclassified Paenibacillus TaxID=185978 RepID=UPI002405103F|nr:MULTISPECIES: LLM class flavin-dependent oxidoreductase [unclassified Paenibacillus]MDF9843133.1 putative LLM family oxidoreductase [Paenibacillus sp. PastF-2]MDF9849655.1 putative LLM family oxidoreductase [Paenibacillus sp. PastM-2]MDF9856427.1 putative LLM family oxidoreductase [Paenibacillus sp. PastF-1]MDH6481699.1 putative LLM family oxidoreductase [Paenibacillus sp. PastH-2]MDH6508980.1 putative LLM family oxidoreductase [Paenibacillus sp. PastM-3]
MEIGISTFLETTPDPVTGEVISHAERLREAVEEIVLADQVGLDVYGIGEHHRADYAGSAPAVVLAAAAAMTKNIRLTSAVSVLSSDDPVRVYQQFATLDGISNGRAEIMAGRGSFIESFPLFGYSLDDYNELFEENLELLLKIRASEKVTWRGGHRPAIDNLPVYPRAVQDPLPVWIATGGNPESAIRAGMLGLPVAFAIIGGMPERFAPLVKLYKEAAALAGHNPDKLQIATHSHGFVGETTEQAAALFYPSTQAQMNVIGRERGWGQSYNRATYDDARSLRGALYVGDSEYVAEKIILLHKNLGVTRFFLHVNVGTMPHREVMRAIELLGTKVAPIVRQELAKK